VPIALLDRRLRRAEEGVGELAAGHVPHVQLDLVGRVRRAGHRVAAARAVLQDQLDELAGEELQPLVGGQLQAHHRHVRGDALDRRDPARHLADRHVAGRGDHPRLDDEVAGRLRAAQQREAALGLLGAQRVGLVRALLDAALHDLRLARPAGAVLAAVGQHHALAKTRLEHGLVGLHGELLAAGHHGDGEAHLVESPG
jgi:hypothetical protein